MLVHSSFVRHGQERPDKTALVFAERRVTYGQLNEESDRLAQAMRRDGLRRGDRVAIFLDNSVEMVTAIYATLKAGAIFSPLSATLKAKKLEYILHNLEPAFLISHASKLPQFASCTGGMDFLRGIVLTGRRPAEAGRIVSWADFVASGIAAPPDGGGIDLDLAYIIYTSGSTGEPKGVMMTHANVLAAARAIVQYLENREDDILLDVLPLSFDYGLYQVLMAFLFGGTVVLEKNFAYPYVVVDKLLKERVTGFPAVPTIFSILLQLELKKYDFRHLRYLSNTGAALPVPHIRALREVFPQARLYSMYGLTECKRVSYLPPEQLDRRPSSVGRGMPNEEVFIVDERGERVGAGEAGELVVRGSNVMRGYWRAPQETAQRLKPGLYPGETVLYTGDLFTADEEGYLYFVARKDDLIKTRGERVSPTEVEEALCEIDGVIEAAVVPVPDEILGSAIKAFIKTDPSRCELSVADVIRHCTDNLEAFMVPKYVEFVAEFPKTATGKIDKKVLKEHGPENPLHP